MNIEAGMQLDLKKWIFYQWLVKEMYFEHLSGKKIS